MFALIASDLHLSIASDRFAARVPNRVMLVWRVVERGAGRRGHNLRTAVASRVGHYFIFMPGFYLTRRTRHLDQEILVVMSGTAELSCRALDHAVTHWPHLEKVMTLGNFGTDQTPLNFMVKQMNEPVIFFRVRSISSIAFR